jgi:hypothetical protein
MQGKKTYQEKLFHTFKLSDHVPKTNLVLLTIEMNMNETKQEYNPLKVE